MSDLRKAAEKALEASKKGCHEMAKMLLEAALHQALAQPEEYDQTALELCGKCGWKAIIPDEGCLVCARKEQEPYCYAGRQYKNYCEVFPLYRAPPKPEWVGLTDDEFTAIARKYSLPTRVGLEYFKDELEAKLKEKNGG